MRFESPVVSSFSPNSLLDGYGFGQSGFESQIQFKWVVEFLMLLFKLLGVDSNPSLVMQLVTLFSTHLNQIKRQMTWFSNQNKSGKTTVTSRYAPKM